MIKERLKQEKHILEVMIRIYCSALHQKGMLCDDCDEVLLYANSRLNKCPFADRKPTCRKCPHHCYSPMMRKKIREIMKYAGPKMMYLHPLIAFKHLLLEFGLSDKNTNP